jgi:hypothetical protein
MNYSLIIIKWVTSIKLWIILWLLLSELQALNYELFFVSGYY